MRLQLYDREEIMRIHDIGVARDSAIRAIVETYQELGMTFIDAVEKVAAEFALSQEKEVKEYWNEQ